MFLCGKKKKKRQLPVNKHCQSPLLPPPPPPIFPLLFEFFFGWLGKCETVNITTVFYFFLFFMFYVHERPFGLVMTDLLQRLTYARYLSRRVNIIHDFSDFSPFPP